MDHVTALAAVLIGAFALLQLVFGKSEDEQ